MYVYCDFLLLTSKEKLRTPHFFGLATALPILLTTTCPGWQWRVIVDYILTHV